MNDISNYKKYCCPSWYFDEYQPFCFRKMFSDKKYYNCIHFDNRKNCWIRYVNYKRNEIIEKYSEQFINDIKNDIDYGYFKENLIKMNNEIFKLNNEFGV